MGELEDAIAAASARGKVWLDERLASDEMTSGEHMARALGMTSTELARAVSADFVLALGPPDARRYPVWQVIDGGPTPRLPEIFSCFSQDATAVYLFLREPIGILADVSSIEAIRRGHIESVVRIAHGIAHGAYF